MQNIVLKDAAAVSLALCGKSQKKSIFKIVIGDSLSDFEAAKQADIVLARDHLIQRCEELHVSYKPFITFHDCLKNCARTYGNQPCCTNNLMHA
ncbi:hypothetical protein OL548_02135 [Lysinibacillus sp. MHQ-1]|nr:hypothetical protein OL548_02135 [Lysinibacillus sp. MHQ-1]